MRTHALFVLMFASSLACAAASQEGSDAKVDAPQVGRSTATARVQAPVDSKCPNADRGKTASFTTDGCTERACNSARQTAIAHLRGEVDKKCDNYLRADSECVKHGC
jgi:hypothetical protein